MNLLLAEDDAVARMTLSAVLKGLGYEVTVAEHGAEAWAVLQLSHFPMVISDWQMPEIDGAELCRRLRARATDRYTYFLLVTATGGKKRYLEGMEAGADDFITKPVDMDELRARGSKRRNGSSVSASTCSSSRGCCRCAPTANASVMRRSDGNRSSATWKSDPKHSSVTAIARSAMKSMCDRRSRSARQR